MRLDLTEKELQTMVAWAETGLSGLHVGGARILTRREEQAPAKLRAGLATAQQQRREACAGEGTT